MSKDKKRKPRGLGDTIKNVTERVGIRQCGGCKKRQEKLNKLFPYKDKDKKE
tara:strand:+ start:9878 stop:10033 length:156 start_codon:yes stop_codon:yes gene_type:complete